MKPFLGNKVESA